MTPEEIRKQMQEGMNQLQPRIVSMSTTLADCYILGFKTCWKILTGKDFDL